ncbi:GTPase HflX [bacterium]|nr:GTPase HflX [bacterium]
MKESENILEQSPEKAVLVALVTKRTRTDDPQESLQELELLAETAGAVVLNKVIQKKDRRDSHYYIGKGKLAELAQICQDELADLVIFDDELSPGQVKNLEEYLKIKVLDRTDLILDIFAIHARTKQARLQVELAHLNYNLPRLKRRWTHLERQRGGIGVRGGPGERQIEVDRRQIDHRISSLKKELEEIEKQHRVQRKLRSSKYNISLVGYTNAGKTTLLNALAREELYTADQLFATLDTTTRRVSLNGNLEVLISDTVGFIKKLPHHLIASFHATLEEAIRSDLLIHLVDASHPHFEHHIEAVNKVLTKLNINDKNILLVFNKIDLLEELSAFQSMVDRNYPNSLFISASRGDGLDELKGKLMDFATASKIKLALRIPFSEGKIISFLYDNGEVESEEYLSDHILFKVQLPRELFYMVEDYVV